MFVRVGSVNVTCIKKCSSCPMVTSPVDWKALTELPCCDKIWVPASFLSQATAKNKVIDRGKAVRLFLKSLGVL